MEPLAGCYIISESAFETKILSLLCGSGRLSLRPEYRGTTSVQSSPGSKNITQILVTEPQDSINKSLVLCQATDSFIPYFLPAVLALHMFGFWIYS